MYNMVDDVKMNNQKNSKKIIIIVLICLLVILLIAAGVFGYFYKTSSDEVEEINTVVNESFKDLDVEFGYGNEITCEDLQLQLINQTNLPENTNLTLEINGRKLSDGETFVFDRLGKYTVKLTATTEHDSTLGGSEPIQNERVIEINVKDLEKPVIRGIANREISVGDEINLLEGITATDDVDEKVEVAIEGEVDVNTPGDYQVKAVARDSSGNIAEEIFTVTVK